MKITYEAIGQKVQPLAPKTPEEKIIEEIVYEIRQTIPTICDTVATRIELDNGIEAFPGAVNQLEALNSLISHMIVNLQNKLSSRVDETKKEGDHP